MEILFAIALMTALLLPSELWESAPSWLSRVPPRLRQLEPDRDGEQHGAADDGLGEPVEMSVQPGLFAAQLIRCRLDALTEELERLDRDPEIFAKAFHTTVARSAYEALMADASKISSQPRLHVGETLDFELVGPSTGPCEELEL